jgi:hypothetical protein
MKEYTKKPETPSRTINRTPKAPGAASIHDILQEKRDGGVEREGVDRGKESMAKTVQMELIDSVVKSVKKNIIIQRTITPPSDEIEYIINKQDILDYQKILKNSILVYMANLEARRSNDHRILNIDEVKKLNCLNKLQTAYTDWMITYDSIITEMENTYYVKGNEAKDSFEYKIIAMKDKLLGLIDDYNSIFNDTFEDTNNANIIINTLVVRDGINLNRLKSNDSEGIFALLSAGKLTDRHKNVIGINSPQHQHLHGGDMGIAFTYIKQVDGSITPYLYDYADHRQGNKYQWKKANLTQSGPPPIV